MFAMVVAGGGLAIAVNRPDCGDLLRGMLLLHPAITIAAKIYVKLWMGWCQVPGATWQGAHDPAAGIDYRR